MHNTKVHQPDRAPRKARLMEPALCKEFREKFTREMNHLRIEPRTDHDAWRRELAKIEKPI